MTPAGSNAWRGNSSSEWKTSKSLIRSFLESDLRDSLTIANFLWAMWANRSWSLINGERPEQFAHIAHFWWATWAIHSHHSLKKREWVNCSFKKPTKNTILVKFFWVNRSFLWAKERMSNSLRKNEQFAHLVIYHERFAHSHSFVMSDLSESLTVAHLTWGIWANEQMSKWAMSEWAIPNPAKKQSKTYFKKQI